MDIVVNVLFSTVQFPHHKHFLSLIVVIHTKYTVYLLVYAIFSVYIKSLCALCCENSLIMTIIYFSYIDLSNHNSYVILLYSNIYVQSSFSDIMDCLTFYGRPRPASTANSSIALLPADPCDSEVEDLGDPDVENDED